MARIKYAGPVDPMSIPGIGPVGNDFVECPDSIAREFDGEKGFIVEFDQDPGKSNQSALKKVIRGGEEK